MILGKQLFLILIKLILQILKSFIKNRTTLIVTHRMSTLELVDKIMVMDNGQVIDYGTHEELLNRCKIYHRLREMNQDKAA